MTIAFWCVLAAGILPQLVGIYAKTSKEYDNENPREYLAQLEGRSARAVAAMANGYEGLPLFFAAVIIAHLAQVDPFWLNAMALTYVISRVVYNVLYVVGLGTLRSVVWLVGLGSVVTLFVMAA